MFVAQKLSIMTNFCGFCWSLPVMHVGRICWAQVVSFIVWALCLHCTPLQIVWAVCLHCTPLKVQSEKYCEGPNLAVQGETPPPLSPVIANGGALMEAHARGAATPDAMRASAGSLDGGAGGGGAPSEAGSRAPSESGDQATREGHKKGRFKVWLLLLKCLPPWLGC